MYAYVVFWQFGFIPIDPTYMYRMLLNGKQDPNDYSIITFFFKRKQAFFKCVNLKQEINLFVFINQL